MSAPAGFSLRLRLQSFIQRLVSVSHLGQRWTASYRFSASEGCNEMRGITTWQFGHVTRPIGRRFEPSRSLWGWTSTASGMASSRSPTARQEQPNCSLKAGLSSSAGHAAGPICRHPPRRRPLPLPQLLLARRSRGRSRRSSAELR